jgi:prephenate dehydratase
VAVTIAFQGEPGAFSDDAARTLVTGAQTRGFTTFDEAFAAVERGATDFALLPVENSISGSVPRVYDLLWGSPELAIAGEIVYRVVQNLIGTPDAEIDALREVRSHPVALEQCRRFLGAHPNVRIAVVADTAGAVREIAALGDRSVGAIASSLAAERYEAKVLAASIQDVDANFTRFFLIAREGARSIAREGARSIAREGAASIAREGAGSIAREGAPSQTPSRACVALVLANKPGALRDALSAFADRGLDLRTVVTRPSLDEPFTYRFYCEIASAARTDLDAALAAIAGTSRLLGYY